jgi:transcriptional regulator with XRE-family HTH domain
MAPNNPDIREDGLRELREIRLRRGLSQADLSAMTSVAEFTISEIELGKRANPRPSTLRKLAKGLGVEVTDLYGESDSPLGAAPSSQGKLFNNGGLEDERRPSLDEVRDTFAPLAEGLNHYCAHWEEKLPTLQGTREEVADFVLGLWDFRSIIMRVLEDELWAIAISLDLGSRYGDESGLPYDVRLGFIRGEAEQHSLMHEAIKRYVRVTRALAERTDDEETVESMRQALTEVGV